MWLWITLKKPLWDNQSSIYRLAYMLSWVSHLSRKDLPKYEVRAKGSLLAVVYWKLRLRKAIFRREIIRIHPNLSKWWGRSDAIIKYASFHKNITSRQWNNGSICEEIGSALITSPTPTYHSTPPNFPRHPPKHISPDITFRTSWEFYCQ